MLATALAILTLQSQAHTETVVVSPKFRDGVHFACEASFDAYVQDTAYSEVSRSPCREASPSTTGLIKAASSSG